MFFLIFAKKYISDEAHIIHFPCSFTALRMGADTFD